MDQESGVLAGWFWLRLSHELAVEIPGLQSSKGLTGARGFTLKICNSPGYWLEASFPLHRDSSTGLLECPHNVAAGFQRE